MGDWRAEEATIATIVRDLNEWTEDDSDAGPDAACARHPYLCECGDARCRVSISLTHSEYAGVRALATRFVLAVDHENPEIDTIVAENDRFATIEKSVGEPVRIARARDPRR